MSSSLTDATAVPPQSRGSWTSFLKSIASFNGDLSTLTAPPFILSTTSLVEYSAYWAEHPSLFVAPASELDPQKRMVLVLKWFLSTLKSQYSSRNEKLGSEKKPLNPFLGELFLGSWTEQNAGSEVGETTLVSEQVSHHPPVTAYCITNPKHKVRLQGYNGQKASFSSTIHVKQVGHALLTLFTGTPSQETYLITLPSLHIEGLIYGTPFVELSKSTYIASSTGYTAKVDYSGKGWLSGKKNSVTATIYPSGREKDTLYIAEGQWNDAFSIKHVKGKTEVASFAAKKEPVVPLTVAPVEQQGPLESRRAWQKVAEAIKKGDMETTSMEKSKIENEQREMRKKEQSEGREWERRCFSKRDTVEGEVQTLVSAVPGWEVEPDKTGGVWRYDEAKAQKVTQGS